MKKVRKKEFENGDIFSFAIRGVEGSSACLCSFSTCSVLFFIIHKFLLFFSFSCICQLFFGLHLHGFGLIVLFL